MRKLIALMLLALPMIAEAQKIDKNEIDKFTGERFIETKYETIADFTHGLGNYGIIKFAVRYYGDNWRLLAMIKISSSEKYDEDSGITLLFDNGEVITLKTLYTGITGRFGDFTTTFAPTEDDIKIFKEHLVTDIRVTTLSQFYDFTVKKGNQDKLMKMVKLVESVASK